jgi:hypothetical protein
MRAALLLHAHVIKLNPRRERGRKRWSRREGSLLAPPHVLAQRYLKGSKLSDARLSESHGLFPGFLLVCLHKFLVCLWHHVAKQASIGRHDRHHRVNHLLWLTLKRLASQKVEKLLDVGSFYEVPGVVLPAKGRLGLVSLKPVRNAPGLMVCTWILKGFSSS